MREGVNDAPACVRALRRRDDGHRGGGGRGGRNQEFALAMAEPLARIGGDVVAASVGTDGIDGPTDAAGAVVDTTTVARARAAGAGAPAQYLAENDSYHFFDAIGDLVRTGPTDTNVGDLQVVLVN
jgi:hydroxypyruvate reductase